MSFEIRNVDYSFDTVYNGENNDNVNVNGNRFRTLFNPRTRCVA